MLSLGGDDGIRTHDPLLAGQVLSQLSYTPVSSGFRPAYGVVLQSPRALRRGNSVSALTYLPGTSPSEYFRHPAA